MSGKLGKRRCQALNAIKEGWFHYQTTDGYLVIRLGGPDAPCACVGKKIVSDFEKTGLVQDNPDWRAWPWKRYLITEAGEAALGASLIPTEEQAPKDQSSGNRSEEDAENQPENPVGGTGGNIG